MRLLRLGWLQARLGWLQARLRRVLQNRARREAGWSRLGPADLFGSPTARGDNFLALKMTYWLPVK